MTTPNGNTDPITPEPAGTGGTQDPSSTGTQTTDWESAYKGLQSTYQKLKNSSDKTIADLQRKLNDATANVEELKQGGVAADSQLDVLKKQNTDLQSQVEDLQGQLKAKDAVVERKDLVLGEFPELAEFEAQGLLPTADDPDSLRNQLQTFQKTFLGKVSGEVKKTMTTASPTGSGRTSTAKAPNGAVEESEDYIWEQMTKFAGRDQGKFLEWQAKYDELQAQKQ